MDATTADFVAELVIRFVLGFIVSWSIGLMPAIIYRYAIYKRPIEKKKVLWRLAPIVIVLAFLFKMTNAALASKRPSGNPIPWIIIYFVGKWIMTRTPRWRDGPVARSISPQPISLTPTGTSLQASLSALKTAVAISPSGAQSSVPVAAQHTAVAPHKKRMSGCLLVFLIVLGLMAVGVSLGIYVGGKALMNSAKESVEKSPLYLAVAANNIAEVDRLLAAGANPDERALMGHSPLIMAARCDYSLIAERLLKAGANPNQKDTLQWAPLHHAVKTDNANLDMISILVRYRADVNITDKHLRTPLHRAAQFGHVEAVRLLLRLGADPNAKDENGWTPLDRGSAHPAVRQVLGEQ